jgi:1,5-anhydro-D-fructose reductase (1,5-anhydro-D-mannitol-forming)
LESGVAHTPVSGAPLRWGIIGTGWIVTDFMVPAMRLTETAQPVALRSRSAGRAAEVARTHGIPRAYDSVARLVEDEEVDAVYIATLNEQHHDQVIAASEAGKHVLCEKPLALNVADARHMVSACHEANVILGVNHHLRSAPTVRRMRAAVESGEIGVPLSASVAFAGSLIEPLRTWRLDAQGGGVMLDLTVHSADLLRYLLGAEIVECAAIAAAQGLAREGAADAAMSVLRLSGNVIATIHDAFTVPYGETRVEVHGTRGSIVGHNVMTQLPVGTVELRTQDGSRELDVPRRGNLYVDVLERFAAAVRDGTSPGATGEDGLRSLAAALAVAWASAHGCTTRPDHCEGESAGRRAPGSRS